MILSASSARSTIAPRTSRTWGISSSSPFLRYTYFPPWLDVRCPCRRFTSSLAWSLSYDARRNAIRVPSTVVTYARNTDKILKPSGAHPGTAWSATARPTSARSRTTSGRSASSSATPAGRSPWTPGMHDGGGGASASPIWTRIRLRRPELGAASGLARAAHCPRLASHPARTSPHEKRASSSLEARTAAQSEGLRRRRTRTSFSTRGRPRRWTRLMRRTSISSAPWKGTNSIPFTRGACAGPNLDRVRSVPESVGIRSPRKDRRSNEEAMDPGCGAPRTA